jgi:hypothetical protein
VIWARKPLVEATADLGAGVGVDHRVGLARDGRAVGVADRDQGEGALLAGVRTAIRVSAVSPDWRDGDHQRAGVDDRVAVAELGGQLDLAGIRVQCSMAYFATIPA